MGQGRPIESKGRRFGGWARGARRPKACSPAPSTLLIWFAIAVVWIPPADGQDLDVTRESIRGIRKNVVWENLTHSKQFLRGVRPKRVVPTKPATVILGAGEGVEFLVPAHEMIQVVSVDGVQIDDGLTQIWTSDGSGLYRKLISAVSDRGCSILAAPNESGYSVAKVCRSESSIGQVRLAIYTSARPPTQTLDYYNCPILSTECVSISDDRGTRPRDYAFMESGRRAKFSMAGASRLRVEARLRFDLQSQRRQTYWIRVYVDGKLYRVVSMDTEPTGTRRQFVNGKERLIGRREFAYLDLDCGDKKVEIEVSHNCYLRIDGVGLDLCRPFLNRSFPYPTWQNVKSATTIWDASDWNTLAWESFDGTDAKLIHATGSADSGGSFAVDQKAPSGIWNPYLNQQRIQAIARDNSVRHGGLRAYMWVLACAARHVSDVRFGDEISLSEWCERIRNRYTQFMDTPIVQLPGNATFRRVAYVRRKVRSPQQDRTERIVGAQHLESSLASIGHVGLLDVTDDCSEPLRYRFPKTLGTSIVRLVVDPSKLTGNIRLWVRYDHRSPIEWMISPKDCLDKQRFVPTAAEAILSARKGTYGRYDQLTAGGPFAMSRENVATICASTAEIIKPAEVEEMEIWIESCHGGSQEQSIGIGVLHLDARKTRLSEKSYRYLADLVDCESEDAPTKAFARRELDNDALQLESELRSHHRGIRESVRQHPIVNPAQDPWDQATIDSQQMLIKELIEKAPPGGTNWPAIIELLSDLIRNADGQSKYDAVLARVDALQS